MHVRLVFIIQVSEYGKQYNTKQHFHSRSSRVKLKEACAHMEDGEVASGREDDGDGDGEEGADERHDIRQERHKPRGRQTAARHDRAHRKSPEARWHTCASRFSLSSLHVFQSLRTRYVQQRFYCSSPASTAFAILSPIIGFSHEPASRYMWFTKPNGHEWWCMC